MTKYSREATEYVLQALEGGPSPRGLTWVEDFEVSFAERLDVPFAVAMNSGTSAIHAGLAALGVGPGDEIISPALTVVMDSFAALYLGAVPVFADVDPMTWNVDPRDVEQKITSRTRAIIAVSWFGAPVDIAPLRDLSVRTGIPILDDSAETLLAKAASGRYAGTEADIGVFSFEQKKHLTTGGEGGMLVTSDPDLAASARRFGGIGYRHLTASAGRTSLDAATFHDPQYARFSSVGFNYRMTPLTAAIGLGQLLRLDEALWWRRHCADGFLSVVDDCEWLTPQLAPEGAEHAFYTLGLRYDGDQHHGKTWQEFYKAFVRFGGDGFYGNCLNPYREPVFQSTPRLASVAEQGISTNPVANELQPRIMALKTHYRDEQELGVQLEALSQAVKWCLNS